MIRELLAHTDYVRVLSALEREPMRFGRIQRELELHPPQVARALEFLTRSKLIAPAAADTATGVYRAVYALPARRRDPGRPAEVADLTRSVVRN